MREAVIMGVSKDIQRNRVCVIGEGSTRESCMGKHRKSWKSPPHGRSPGFRVRHTVETERA
jgi:hypothetical protein